MIGPLLGVEIDEQAQEKLGGLVTKLEALSDELGRQSGTNRTKKEKAKANRMKREFKEAAKETIWEINDS
jgi:hypothetical protein